MGSRCARDHERAARRGRRKPSRIALKKAQIAHLEDSNRIRHPERSWQHGQDDEREKAPLQ